MSAPVAVAVALALVFATTNGIQDAATSIATLVATRSARPNVAIVLAAVGTALGPLLLGHAVATTIAGIVRLPRHELVFVVGAGLTGAIAWNVLTWLRGLPSSSGHALLGGLAGAAIMQGGASAVRWGGFRGVRPVGVLGVLAVLAIAPVSGFLAGFVLDRAARRATRRATRRIRGPVRAAQHAMSGALALAHGANDTQKAVGVIAVLLFADGQTRRLGAPTWAVLAGAAALTLGTTLGGWPIVRTLGRRIVALRPIDALASQTASAAILLCASVLGAPVGTSHVVGGSIVGTGAGRGRWRHVRWRAVRAMLIAWLVTIPAAGACAALALVPWRWLA